MLNQNIGLSVIHISECQSTNTYVKEQASQLESGSCVYTDSQLAGRGQLKNSWFTTPKFNITASLFLKPIKLHSSNQFVLSMITSLAIFQYVKEKGIENVKIKWPNDILISKKKVAGILIENAIQENLITQSVIGFGININEVSFPPFERAASSLKLETGRDFIIREELDLVLSLINIYYEKWLIGGYKKLEEEYLSNVYGFDEWVEIEEKGNRTHVKISGIDEWGRLLTKKPDGLSGCYDIKEIKFL